MRSCEKGEWIMNDGGAGIVEMLLTAVILAAVLGMIARMV
jgi:hypothetical protein